MNTRKLHVLVVVISIALLTPNLCSAQAQIFRVGPDGQYATISAALADLLAAPQLNNWIKVETGVTTTENLYFPGTWVEGTIWLSGGWDSSFLTQGGDPTDTVISGGLAGNVIDIQMAGGTLIVSDLSIVDGWSTYGAGIRIEPTDTCSVRLDNLSIHDNVAVGSISGDGGGIYAYLRHTNTLDIADCEIDSNAASGSSSATGGGVRIAAYGGAEFSIIDSIISNNDLYSDSRVGGAGIYLYMDESSSGNVAGCSIQGNTVSNSVAILAEGVGLLATATFSAQLEIERSFFLSNTVGFPVDHQQVKIYGLGDAVVSISDSIVADGQHDGLYLRADEQSTVHTTNLTVSINGDDGIFCNRVSSSTATINISNTISCNNTALDLNISSGPVTQTANLIGVDPEFVDPQDLDFRVEVGSVAEDAGVVSPPGGIGTADFRGGIRHLGAAPDAGAYEGNVSLIFSDGFDHVYTGRWSDVVGLPIR